MYREILSEELKLDITLGYLYFIDREHPLKTGNSNKVMYHRHLGSLKYSKWLTSEDIVHHIDGNKLNNCFSNLEVMSQAEHASSHFRTLTNKECLQCKISYKPNKSTQKYCSIDCHNKSQSKDITIDEIIYWVINFSWSRASKELGLSDNGLRKIYKRLSGLDPKLIRFNHIL